jgi:uncharacterized protein YceK
VNGCGNFSQPTVAGSAYETAYASHYSRSEDAVIPVYDATGNVIETHEHKGDFKEWYYSTTLAIVDCPFAAQVC